MIEAPGSLVKNPLLNTYWFNFPEDPTFPLGLGVTAFSQEDAEALLEDLALYYHRNAKRVIVREGIRFEDIGNRDFAPNSGPLIFRGVWYPCYNIGFTAQHLRTLRRERLYGF